MFKSQIFFFFLAAPCGFTDHSAPTVDVLEAEILPGSPQMHVWQRVSLNCMDLSPLGLGKSR